MAISTHVGRESVNAIEVGRVSITKTGQGALRRVNEASRSHRTHDPGSRGTIPDPPTPHHGGAKADNDRNQDRQDGDSCIILTLPIAE